MREHEGLLNEEELKRIELQAKSKNTDAYLQHYNRLTISKRKRITNILQNFFNDSFINVLEDYRKKNESYLKSYKKFDVFNNLSPYLLVPIIIKPDGIFLKIWAVLRVCTAYLLSLLIPRTFAADILTCFPWYALWKLFVPRHDENHSEEDHMISYHMYHCIIRMANVSQIYKLYAAFWAESIGALKRAYLMSVVQFLLLTLFFLNLYTSILITMSCRYIVAYDNDDFVRKLKTLSLHGPYMETTFNPEGNMVCKLGSWIDSGKIFKEASLTPTKVYLLAYYWAATSFTGAGFGDITAQDTAHMILSICINIHGVLFFGWVVLFVIVSCPIQIRYVYARIASLKAMADQVVTTFQENLKHLQLFLNRERVPYLLKKTVIDYWKYQWKRTGGWSHQKILGKLHANLNEDAVLYMYEKTLREIPLFEDVEYSFFRAFAKKLKERYFQKGYMIMRSNEVLSNMYIIYRGKVDVITNINEVEACMGPGGIFGNIRGAVKYLSISNIVASRNIDLLYIGGSEFYALLKSEVYPLTYEADEDDDDDEIDPNIFLDSPDRSIPESHGSRSIASGGSADYISAVWLIFSPHRWFRSSVIPDCKWVTFIGLLISEMSAMITAHSSSRIEYDYGINELRDGLRDTDLSDHQMNKMWDYVRELWNRQQGKQVEVLTVHQNLTESIYDILGPEDSFGVAQGLFVGVTHHFSFRARTVVDVVYLILDEWKYLLDFYPQSAKLVRRKVENVYLAI
ncbi:unnamed protein product, partial [Brenthis ino]